MTLERVIFKERIANSQSDYASQKEQLTLLKKHTERRLLAFQSKLGELQGHVNRLEAFGDKLAQVANVPNEAFAFEELPAIGGLDASVDNASVNTRELLNEITEMIAVMHNQEQKMEILESILISNYIEDDSSLSGRPVNAGWLSSYFGIRKDPFTGLPAEHLGIDFAGEEGSDVIATGAGVITWSGERYGYGNLIEIDHGGRLKTRYGHNKELLVKVGDVVTKGQTIAKMGSSGRSTGPHVHYEVLKSGKQVDPAKYVYRK